jgi:hypothetical protein
MLSREDILKMKAGREMDALVYWTLFVMNKSMGFNQWKENTQLPIPYYTSNIAAAWDVHKKACSCLFSIRRNYLDMVKECVSERKIPRAYIKGERIAWPDVLVFLEAEDISRAALIAFMEAE